MSSERDNDVTWYAGVIITRSGSSAPAYRPLYEETIIVVQAKTSDDAMAAVRAAAMDRLATFKNEAGDEIVWELETIVEVKELSDSPGHGVEIYSRFFRDYGAYRKFEPLLDGDID